MIRYCHAAGSSSDSSQGLKDWDSVIAAAAEFLKVCWFGMTYGGFSHGVVVFLLFVAPFMFPRVGWESMQGICVIRWPLPQLTLEELLKEGDVFVTKKQRSKAKKSPKKKKKDAADKGEEAEPEDEIDEEAKCVHRGPH
jgi:hypothetical protein